MSLHQRLSSSRQRRALQAVLLTSWLLIVVWAFWDRSATAAVVLGAASGVLGILAVKIGLVDASAVSASTRSANARHRQTRDELARLDQSIGELTTTLHGLRASNDETDLREEVEMLARLVEPYVALVEVQQQEILALREQRDNTPKPITSGARPLFLHYHLPKTGGQTIRRLLEETLDPGTTLLNLGKPTEGILYSPSTNAGVAALSSTERDDVRVVTGHAVDSETIRLFAGRQLWEFTMLRDPAARMVSHFNFARAMAHRRDEEILEFDEWYARRRSDEMSAFLAHSFGVNGTELIDRISQLQFIGNTAQMDEWLPLLLTVMGLPGITPERANVTGVDHERVVQLDDELRTRIEADHPQDVELFRIASTELFVPSLERLRQTAEAVATTGR